MTDEFSHYYREIFFIARDGYEYHVMVEFVDFILERVYVVGLEDVDPIDISFRREVLTWDAVTEEDVWDIKGLVRPDGVWDIVMLDNLAAGLTPNSLS